MRSSCQIRTSDQFKQEKHCVDDQQDQDPVRFGQPHDGGLLRRAQSELHRIKGVGC
jgi:hypothetical protein